MFSFGVLWEWDHLLSPGVSRLQALVLLWMSLPPLLTALHSGCEHSRDIEQALPMTASLNMAADSGVGRVPGSAPLHGILHGCPGLTI